MAQTSDSRRRGPVRPRRGEHHGAQRATHTAKTRPTPSALRADDLQALTRQRMERMGDHQAVRSYLDRTTGNGLR